MNIAIVGKIRSGKDSVVDYLKKHFEFEHLKFATGIKEIIEEYFPSLIKDGKHRRAYQHIGQEMRALDPDVWVNRLSEEYYAKKKIKFYSDNFIISDLRQPNEFQWCKDNGFIIIKVFANDEVRKARIRSKGDVFDEKDFLHETESHIDKYDVDYVVNNSGTMKELYDQLDSIIDDVKSKG